MTNLRIAGVDEAGRGALAGPVVSAAVLLAPDTMISGLADSKQLKPDIRRSLEQKIKRSCLCWAIGIASAGEIDRINILQATLLSMKRAVEGLRLVPDRVLVDGNYLPDIDCPGEAIVKGDAKEPVISAASILAKVTRDTMMRNYAKRFPGYGFESHVGYGTKLHLKSLSQYGATSIHRKTFSPVRNLRQAKIDV